MRPKPSSCILGILLICHERDLAIQLTGDLDRSLSMQIPGELRLVQRGGFSHGVRILSTRNFMLVKNESK
jgi:hypothetical protein